MMTNTITNAANVSGFDNNEKAHSKINANGVSSYNNLMLGETKIKIKQ